MSENTVEQASPTKEQTFWEHLDALRGTLFRSAIVVIILMAAAFCFKDFVFGTIIFGPTTSDFVLYRWFCRLGEWLHMPDFCPEPFTVKLQNIKLAGQFFTHMSVSFWIGIIVGFPYLMWELWRFVSPALYANEKRHIKLVFSFGGLLFFCGVLVGYFLIFPLTLHFLATYQVADMVANEITLDSYISTLTWLVFIMGIVFEMPMIAVILSKMGILKKQMLKKYRKHALVLSFLLAAIITPSGDAFTMIMVGLPIVALYQLSVSLVRK